MRRNERGIALLLCIAALMVLTAIAIGMMYMTDTETQINANYRSSQQAYLAALAGLQNVRERMTPDNVAPHLLTGPIVMPGTGNDSVMYVVNPSDAGDTVDRPTITGAGSYSDNELQAELAAQGVLAWPLPAAYYVNQPALTPEYPASYAGAVNSPIQPYVGTLNYKWVRVTLKGNKAIAQYPTDGTLAAGMPVCYDGANEVPASEEIFNGAPIANCFAGGGGTNPPGWTPVYQLSSLAVTPSGASRMLQMEVAQDPPLTSHGAVDSQDHVTLNGQLTVNGYDYCTCQCTTAKDKSGKNVTTCVDRTTGVACDGSKYAIYAHGTVDTPNSSENMVSAQTPTYVGGEPWPWDLDALVSRFENRSDTVAVTGPPYNWSCTGGNCGTQSNQTFGTLPSSPPLSPVSPGMPGYQITYVPNDVQLSGNNSRGFGILVVNGNLDVHGGFTFDGLIIVKGVISFTGGGSTGVNITGAIIAGQQSLVDNVLGGSVNINYDYCALPQPDKTQPPRVLSFRELNF